MPRPSQVIVPPINTGACVHVAIPGRYCGPESVQQRDGRAAGVPAHGREIAVELRLRVRRDWNVGVSENSVLCGRYRLQRLIGRGGMADVYLAFDETRQAPVAAKLLREDIAEDPDFVRHFRREAEALARLDHPNIVHFYAFEQDGPAAFIVMDYIDGTTLRHRLQEQHGSLELREVTGIVRHLRCAALCPPERRRTP